MLAPYRRLRGRILMRLRSEPYPLRSRIRALALRKSIAAAPTPRPIFADAGSGFARNVIGAVNGRS